MSETARSLTSGRRLARSAVWNLVGMAAPALVALVAIPLLIEGMGKERFGLLTIIWMGVGYFSLFDLGLGRALTKILAERIGFGRIEDFGPLIWTAITLLGLMGVIGGAVLLAFSGLLISRLLNIEPVLHTEAIAAFRILGLGLPLVFVTSALVGLLEAHQRFATIAKIRIPLGVLTFAGPLITLQFTPSLAFATASLLLSRALALIAYFMAASAVRTELRVPRLPRSDHMAPLLSFGGWLTITNIVGPLMTYLDRFLIGAILNMTAVAYYVTPYEILSRMQMLPQAVIGVVFPAMSAAHASDKARLVDLYAGSARMLVFSMLPLTAGVFLFAPEALEIWLGESFRDFATPVVQLLAVGWMVNTLAHPPLTVLQSMGRPDLVAKTHAAELIPYLFALWVFTNAFGIAGTAAAWSLRVLVDTLILNELAGRKLPELHAIVKRTRIGVVVIVALFAAGRLPDSVSVRAALLLLVIGGSAMALWSTFLRYGYRKAPPADPTMKTTRISGKNCLEPTFNQDHTNAKMHAWPEDGREFVRECPVCGTAQRSLLYGDLTDNVFFCAPGRWALYRCRGCHSAYLDPRPTQDTICLAYARYYTHGDTVAKSDYASLGAFRKIRRRLVNGYANWRYGARAAPAWSLGILVAFAMPSLKKVIDREYRHLPRIPRTGGRLLDVGCGDGSFLRLARTCGWEVVGVDPDPKAVANGTRRGLTVHQGGIEHLAGKGELFDVITLNHVIEHVYEPVRLLQACHSLLRPDGQLWLETPNLAGFGHARFRKNWRGLEPPRHLVIFNPSALRYAFVSAGFPAPQDRSRPSACADMFDASFAIQCGRSPYDTTHSPRTLKVQAVLAAIAEVFLASRREFITVTAKKTH